MTTLLVPASGGEPEFIITLPQYISMVEIDSTAGEFFFITIGDVVAVNLCSEPHTAVDDAKSIAPRRGRALPIATIDELKRTLTVATEQTEATHAGFTFPPYGHEIFPARLVRITRILDAIRATGG